MFNIPFLGGIGGTPGIVPGPGQPPPMPTPGAPAGGFYDKVLGGLFGPGPNGEVDRAAQNRAMIQLGLGLMGANRNEGIGLGALNAYQRAANSYQGAMDRAYQNSERKRIEEKEDKRYSEGIQREDKNRQDDREWKLKQWEAEQKARQAEGQAERQSREKVAGMTAQDDVIRAQQAREQFKREQELERQIAPLRAKILAGTATPQEQTSYQLLVTGRMPSGQAGLLGFGMGGDGTDPMSQLMQDESLWASP